MRIACRASYVLVALVSFAAAIAAGCGDGDTPRGGERQGCYRNQTCNTGLVCLSDTCVKPGAGGAGGSGGSTAGRGGAGAGGSSAGTGGIAGAGTGGVAGTSS